MISYVLLYIGVIHAPLWWAVGYTAAPADPQINSAGGL